MGMDYCWSGSASYPRFETELMNVATVFGGQKRIQRPQFIFPEDTNEVLVRWFNDIYGDFSVEETKIIWELVSAHPEIEEISWQIWNELKTCVEFEDGWYIY